MQGRAAAVYGLVFLLVAAGAFAYVTVAEPPEPQLDDPAVTYSSTGENQTFADRTYRLDGFGEQRGQPAATLVWTDEDARSTAEWTHAAEPGGTTVTHENSSYWVRIPQTASPDNFTLLESPGEDGNTSVITDGDGNWVVNDNGSYTDIENYEEFERIEVENGSSISITTEEATRDVRVDSVTNESVTVTWNQPAENELSLRQTEVTVVNGQNVTPHIPGDGTLEIATDQDAIDAYLHTHEDRVTVEQRRDGLRMASVLSLVSFLALLGMAFLPRKE